MEVATPFLTLPLTPGGFSHHDQANSVSGQKRILVGGREKPDGEHVRMTELVMGSINCGLTVGDGGGKVEVGWLYERWGGWLYKGYPATGVDAVGKEEDRKKKGWIKERVMKEGVTKEERNKKEKQKREAEKIREKDREEKEKRRIIIIMGTRRVKRERGK